jgi:hypothetical protein
MTARDVRYEESCVTRKNPWLTQKNCHGRRHAKQARQNLPPSASNPTRPPHTPGSHTIVALAPHVLFVTEQAQSSCSSATASSEIARVEAASPLPATIVVDIEAGREAGGKAGGRVIRTSPHLVLGLA